jgi:hypothetical protein
VLILVAAVQRAPQKAGKLITTVFGFITDGSNFSFAKLSEMTRLSLSKMFNSITEEDLVYSWLDGSLLAARYSSPNTTPPRARRLSGDSVAFTKHIERPFSSAARSVGKIEEYLGSLDGAEES